MNVSKRPPQRRACVVGFSKRVAVGLFEIQIAALLGQNIEHRAPSQFVRLPHDVQVLPGQIANATPVDGDRAVQVALVFPRIPAIAVSSNQVGI